MDNLLNDIKVYVDYLQNEKGLDISICDVHNKIFPYITRLAPLNSHKNFYCTYLKSNSRVQKKCINQQLNVRSKCTSRECFFGTCYAGISEYIFPIMYRNEYLGFISVSSLCANKQKSYRRINHLSEKYGFKESELKKIFNVVSKTEIPTKDELIPLISVLSRLIELLYVESINLILPQKNENIVFSNILNYITENYTKNINIDDISNALHYSKSYISHVFNLVKNISLMFYVNDLRIHKSKELLEKTNFPITEIAYQIGFNDSNYFSSTFKKYTKITPKQYRAMMSKAKPN